jgi:hypothetical protein
MTQRYLCTCTSGWPIWAKFRRLGDCILCAVFLSYRSRYAVQFLGIFSTLKDLTKMGWAKFWAIIIKNSSGHPGAHVWVFFQASFQLDALINLLFQFPKPAWLLPPNTLKHFNSQPTSINIRIELALVYVWHHLSRKMFEIFQMHIQKKKTFCATAENVNARRRVKVSADKKTNETILSSLHWFFYIQNWKKTLKWDSVAGT